MMSRVEEREAKISEKTEALYEKVKKETKHHGKKRKDANPLSDTTFLKTHSLMARLLLRVESLLQRAKQNQSRSHAGYRLKFKFARLLIQIPRMPCS